MHLTGGWRTLEKKNEEEDGQYQEISSFNAHPNIIKSTQLAVAPKEITNLSPTTTVAC